MDGSAMRTSPRLEGSAPEDSEDTLDTQRLTVYDTTSVSGGVGHWSDHGSIVSDTESLSAFPEPSSSSSFVSSSITRKLLTVLTVLLVVAVLAYLGQPFLASHLDGVPFPPRSMQHVKDLQVQLRHAVEKHPYAVMGAIFVPYVFLMTFGIPGTIFLSVLSGALFGLPLAFAFLSVTAALGAASGYGMSHHLTSDTVQWLFPKYMEFFSAQVADNRHHIFNYMLFLRLTPFLPNWFVNIAAPWVGIPFSEFFWATALGLMPNHLLAINAGLMLSEIESANDVLRPRAILLLACLGSLAVLPVFIKRKAHLKTTVTPSLQPRHGPLKDTLSVLKLS